MTTPISLQGYRPPLAIGGVGGSGTRLIAQCVQQLGWFLGDDLNQAHDNLWFALLFTRPAILEATDAEFSGLAGIFLKAMTGCGPFTSQEIETVHRLAREDRLQHDAHWLMKRANSLLSRKTTKSPDTRWGWKAPNSHIMLDRLAGCFPGMKYIHVVRNGLDMAFSDNQNQLKIWGAHFFGDDFEISPRYSLKYWCLTHKRVLQSGAAMGTDFLFLNYDAFCSAPAQGIGRLTDFLGLDADKAILESLARQVKAPASIGRYKMHGTDMFADEDIAYVGELGFQTALD